jgi:hypothetical protein
VTGTHEIWQVPLLQIWLFAQVPQLAVRPPHPSETWPQVAPRLVQVAGVQLRVPHWPGTPAPPQLWPVAHDPQVRRLPQPSPIEPHDTPWAAQVVGVQVGVTHWLFAQSCVELHGLPQLRTLPHPSEASPQARPAHVDGVHVDIPHTFGPPPPHDCPVAQLPHETSPPHPSG